MVFTTIVSVPIWSAGVHWLQQVFFYKRSCVFCVLLFQGLLCPVHVHNLALWVLRCNDHNQVHNLALWVLRCNECSGTQSSTLSAQVQCVLRYTILHLACQVHNLALACSDRGSAVNDHKIILLKTIVMPVHPRLLSIRRWSFFGDQHHINPQE